MAFMVGEVFMPSFGALGIGGVVAFVVGSLILMDTDVEGFAISLPVVIALSLVSAAFFILVTTLALRQRQRPVVSGTELLVGSLGEADGAIDGGSGYVYVRGERWKATTPVSLASGQPVRVRAVTGLVLDVEPAEPQGRER
jgi:membrane-bound serine protease (ClpP class)